MANMKYLLNCRSLISLMILFSFFDNFGTKKYDYLFKVVFVGDAAVGKTQIINKFVNNSFSDNYLTIIGIDFNYKIINSNGKIIKLQLWDTAGQEIFRGITRAYYKKFNFFVIVYAINNKKSFENIQSWVEDVKTQNKDAKFLLVGNKCDLKGDKRQVTKEEAEEYAKKYNMKFFEVSAKTGTNIEKMFDNSLKKLFEDMKKKKKKEGKKVIILNKDVEEDINHINNNNLSFCNKYCSCCPCLETENEV